MINLDAKIKKIIENDDRKIMLNNKCFTLQDLTSKELTECLVMKNEISKYVKLAQKVRDGKYQDATTEEIEEVLETLESENVKLLSFKFIHKALKGIPLEELEEIGINNCVEVLFTLATYVIDGGNLKDYDSYLKKMEEYQETDEKKTE